LSTLKLESCG